MTHDRLPLLVSVALWLLPSPFAALRRMMKNEYSQIVYAHYKLRAESKKAVHAAKDPISCSDGLCKKI